MLGSLRGYAAHRKSAGLSGGSLAAVQKALASKRIQTSPDGRIDFEKADEQWAANSNRSQQRSPRREKEPTRSAKPSKRKSESETPYEPEADEPHEGNFLVAQTRHEWLKVQKEELNLRVRRGELIEKSELEEVWTKALMAFRNRMTLMPDKLAPRVATTSDVLECRDLIEREVREVLNTLSEHKNHAAA